MSCKLCRCVECMKENNKQETRFYIPYNEFGKPVITAVQRPVNSSNVTYKKTAKEALEQSIANTKRDIENFMETIKSTKEYLRELETLVKET